jgi:protein-tyrosine phosphatase
VKQPCRVLFVCSANLCRSVIAAEYARRAIANKPSSPLEWYVTSAGTDVGPNQGLPPKVAQAMKQLDVAPRDQPLLVSEAYVQSADVILTAEQYHRAVIARRFPFAIRYTFTLLEFARLFKAGRDASPNATVHDSNDLLTLARSGRGHVHGSDDTIDIPDPIAARSGKAVINCARTIEAAVATIIV